jgi:2-methylfumaryl-CoA hydratase
VTKTEAGNFFEDFRLGQVLEHATPRTLTQGDQAVYLALTGSRFALQCSDEFSRALGLRRAPIDDLLAFHIVFGKTVHDVSLNAVANLGYAAGVFGAFLYPGDTVTARSEVIGLKENTNGETGIVYVRSQGLNQRGEKIVDYVRWVMVKKRDAASPAPAPHVPKLPETVAPDAIVVPDGLRFERYDRRRAGSRWAYDDYEIGERIDHRDGMTLEEAEHAMATRLYQNTARVHFDAHEQKGSRFGRRLVYGGHVISLARALSFNGLGNAVRVAAINGGRHAAPCFAGDTLYAWTEVIGKAPAGNDVGALRLRTIATKDRPCADFPREDPAVVLELDYWALLPR